MNPLSRPKILVIDPDALSLTAISAMLHSADYEVHIAQDEQAALQGASQLPIDLIVCDEQIDERQGADIIAKLRQLANSSDAPIMYMSTLQGPDIIQRPHDKGAAYHLRKPIDPKVLLELVDKALWQLPLINNRVRQPHFQLESSGSTHLQTSPSPAS